MKRFKVGDKAIVTGFPAWDGSTVTITAVNNDSLPADYYVSRTLPAGVIDYTEASLNDNELVPIVDVCRVESIGHCDQCDHPCAAYFERGRL